MYPSVSSRMTFPTASVFFFLPFPSFFFIRWRRRVKGRRRPTQWSLMNQEKSITFSQVFMKWVLFIPHVKLPMLRPNLDFTMQKSLQIEHTHIHHRRPHTHNTIQIWKHATYFNRGQSCNSVKWTWVAMRLHGGEEEEDSRWRLTVSCSYIEFYKSLVMMMIVFSASEQLQSSRRCSSHERETDRYKWATFPVGLAISHRPKAQLRWRFKNSLQQ